MMEQKTSAVNIVVIVQSATNRRIIRNALQLIGHTNVTSCDDAGEALDHLADNPIDALIVGKELAGTQGANLAHNVRSSADLPDVPILMVGYQFTEDDVVHAIGQGVDSFLLMPFSPEALQEKISRMANEAR